MGPDGQSRSLEMLDEKGIKIDSGPVHIESLDLWVAFFPDPSGVLVEISKGLDRI